MIKSQCVHYWAVDSLNVGICKFCGAERDFGRLQGIEVEKLSDKQRGIAYDSHSLGNRPKGIVRNPYGRRGRPRENERLDYETL